MKLILRLDTVRGKGKHPLSLFLCSDVCKVGIMTKLFRIDCGRVTIVNELSKRDFGFRVNVVKL